ncbi:MAG: formate-dependent phosphoribosylglycinamide formyltransferase [Deltaproteobacteria bacterium]|jgi:phosphoribosylglycinamide formyltransferase 2|nr:formate-dependent phosphoribosylglycinamide formyltransferase [Deltaproteobacteria bacterium]
MVSIGTPLAPQATKLMLLGSGELGREVALEAMRLGVEVIALDRYPNAPAMQVAHRSYVLSMLDGPALRKIIEQEKPDFIVPEIEAIATPTLIELEKEGHTVIPTAKAAFLTMNREGIRRLAAEELQLPTSPYRFAGTFDEFQAAAAEIGLPCFVKPVMSSSGKGQSFVRAQSQLEKAWAYAQSGGRAGAGRVIVEGFINFDYEITLLTVRHIGGTTFCEPIGHFQEDGDYRFSWQPQLMSPEALKQARHIAATVTEALCTSEVKGTHIVGRGIFGVELFVKEDKVWFSEVSPRPHDTGLVTCISQNLSECALHVRAILGLPVPAIRQLGPAASAAFLVHGNSGSSGVCYADLDKALQAPDTNLMLFGKPEVQGRRRMGVGLALNYGADNSVAALEIAKDKAKAVIAAVRVKF